MSAKRSLAIALLLFFLFAILSSHLLIIAEADHDCCGEDCAICKIIAIAEETIKGLTLLMVAATLFGAIRVVAAKSRPISARNAFHFTPVLLKVKLSN